MWRFAILYFLLLIIFVALFAGPLILQRLGIAEDIVKNFPAIVRTEKLVQPTNQANNDTLDWITGIKNTTNVEQTAAARLF